MNITLIGMPGVGKSVIGKALSLKLGFAFLDADTLIEKNAHLSLQQIIDIYGESAFLRMEEHAILELGSIDNHVICPGGSVVYSDSAMAFLRKHSVVFFLDSSLSAVQGRVGNQAVRGIVGAKEKSLETIYRERVPLYRKFADTIITIPDLLDVQQAVTAITQALSGY